jgi:hypothetical protein
MPFYPRRQRDDGDDVTEFDGIDGRLGTPGDRSTRSPWRRATFIGSAPGAAGRYETGRLAGSFLDRRRTGDRRALGAVSRSGPTVKACA